jgi:ribosomal protein S4
VVYVYINIHVYVKGRERRKKVKKKEEKEQNQRSRRVGKARQLCIHLREAQKHVVSLSGTVNC